MDSGVGEFSSGGTGEINVSAGTAAVLGLQDVRMDVAPTTAYLMLGGRCSMNCGFCAQARQSHASALRLSRITWPAFSLAEVAKRVGEAYRRDELHRACLQVTVAHEAYQQTLGAVRALRAESAVPVDVAILPRSLDDVRELIDAGVDHIGFGLDAACRRVFEQVKTGDWERSMAMIRQTASAYEGRTAVHLIVGLGETEREMAEMIQAMHDLGVTVGLFAFTPVRGTALQGRPAPTAGTYRRMQAARLLIAEDKVRAAQLVFDEAGRLVDVGVAGWRSWLADGCAFETSGCPDCNRPYYNERPGGMMYNYPRRLTPAEVAQGLLELEMRDAADVAQPVSRRAAS